jgi:protein disulfide-isomerase
MRSIFYSLLSLATVATTLAVDKTAKRDATSDDDWDEKAPDTIFNGQPVPPMIELGTNLEQEISHGNW